MKIYYLFLSVHLSTFMHYPRVRTNIDLLYVKVYVNKIERNFFTIHPAVFDESSVFPRYSPRLYRKATPTIYTSHSSQQHENRVTVVVVETVNVDRNRIIVSRVRAKLLPPFPPLYKHTRKLRERIRQNFTGTRARARESNFST